MSLPNPISFQEADALLASRQDAPTYLKSRELAIRWSDEARQAAFFSARCMSASILSQLHRVCESVCSGKMTRDQAVRLMREYFVGEGADPLAAMGFAPKKGAKGIAELASIPRLQLIVYQNVKMAQERGHYEQWKQVRDSFPYGIWRCGVCENHREKHLARDGKVYAFDHPIWTQSPPGGEYNCHCYRELVSAKDLVRLGLSPEPLDSDFEPSALGFDPSRPLSRPPLGKTVLPQYKADAERSMDEFEAAPNPEHDKRMEEQRRMEQELATTGKIYSLPVPASELPILQPPENNLTAPHSGARNGEQPQPLPQAAQPVSSVPSVPAAPSPAAQRGDAAAQRGDAAAQRGDAAAQPAAEEAAKAEAERLAKKAAKEQPKGLRQVIGKVKSRLSKWYKAALARLTGKKPATAAQPQNNRSGFYELKGLKPPKTSSTEGQHVKEKQHELSEKEQHILEERKMGNIQKQKEINAIDLPGFVRIAGRHTRMRDARAVNPKFTEEEQYSINCQRCVIAYEARRRGWNVEAKGCPDMDDYLLNGGWRLVFDGLRETPAPNIDEIERYMGKVFGEGSRAIVYVKLGLPADGHLFIAERINGKTVLVNPQNPSDNPNRYLANAEMRYTSLYRIDNLKFNVNLIGECIKNKE